MEGGRKEQGEWMGGKVESSGEKEEEERGVKMWEEGRKKAEAWGEMREKGEESGR